MRSILLITIMALSATLTAQAQTAIDIRPEIAANCQLRDYPVYNVISDIKAVYEDETQAVFEFNFQSGSCYQQNFLQAALYSDLFYVHILEGSVKTSARQVDQNNVIVQLRIIKAKFFKKTTARQFHMNIRREGAFGNPQSHWWVTGVLQADQTTSLQMQRGSM